MDVNDKQDRLPRCYSIKDILSYNGEVLDFTGEWRELIGLPEKRGVWIIWGRSGHGKSTFAMQMAKYLTNFGNVYVNSIEMGRGAAIKEAYLRVGMGEIPSNKVKLGDQEPMSIVDQRCSRRNGPDFLIIDSLQYCGLNAMQIRKMTERHPKRVFIFISHEQGSEPKGDLGFAVKHLAHVKIRVHDFKAYIDTTRYSGGSGKPIIIWDR